MSRAGGRRLAAALVAAALGILAGACGDGRDGAGSPEDGPGEPVAFDLYFPSDDGYLRPERRELAVTTAPRERARAIVLALLDGPEDGALAAPFAEEVTLLDVYLDPAGVAYVDLGSEANEDPPSGGSTAEMMRVYSVVDSVALNIPEVRRVALLWNGVQRESFSGHLDTSQPLRAREDLLAPPARRQGG